jgi:citrate synthase
MEQIAKLVVDGKTFELPIVIGSEGERAVDISRLRQETGLVTLDPGFVNTANCQSSITFVDGEKGILRYRGIPVEQLAEHSRFVETAYLLINGRAFFENFPRLAHPMGILSSMVNALRAFYPEIPERSEEEEITITVTRLLSKLRTMAALSYKIFRGHKVIYPRQELPYAANFLNMMFDSPVRSYEIDPDVVKALNVFWILHADHEQNCSTAAVRLVGSAKVNLYAAISAGISALWGPLHGGANQAVVEMLREIHASGGDPDPFLDRARDKNDPFRLMGFGHRVYKAYDPRGRIMKEACDKVLGKVTRDDPLLDIAKRLEEVALKDSYFIDHNLYPNIDFYSGILLRAIRIPVNMFTVMFAIGRLPGWISQWEESMETPHWKMQRPRQIYTGPEKKDYVPIEKRG